HGAKSCREERVVAPSYVFAGVGGYYASKQSGLAGVFRRGTDGTDWKHALSEDETFAGFVYPHDPNLFFADTAHGEYRSTHRGRQRVSKHGWGPNLPACRLSRLRRAGLVIPAG